MPRPLATADRERSRLKGLHVVKSSDKLLLRGLSDISGLAEVRYVFVVSLGGLSGGTACPQASPFFAALYGGDGAGAVCGPTLRPRPAAQSCAVY